MNELPRFGSRIVEHHYGHKAGDMVFTKRRGGIWFGPYRIVEIRYAWGPSYGKHFIKVTDEETKWEVDAWYVELKPAGAAGEG